MERVVFAERVRGAGGELPGRLLLTSAPVCQDVMDGREEKRMAALDVTMYKLECVGTFGF